MGPTARRINAPGLDTLYTLVFAVFGLGVGIERLSDNSFFLHLRTGWSILDGGVPHVDPYSYVASGTSWVAQSWLAEAIYGGLDRIAGAFAIRGLMAIIAALVFAFVFRLALRITKERLRAALLCVAALAPLFTLWSERPLAFGLLFFVALIWVVEVPESWVGRHEIVVLVGVFWCWANIHGSFALGFAYLGLHLVGGWVEGRRPWAGRERRLLAGGIVAFLACFVNPYGASLVTFPVELITRSEALRDVVEWSSPNFHRASGIAYLAWVVVFVAVVAVAKRRVTVRDLLVAVPFLILGFWALRNIALAPLVGLPVACRCLEARSPGASPGSGAGAGPPEQGRVPAFAILVLVGVLAVGIVARAATEPDFAFAGYPTRAMDAVRDQDLLGRRLLTDDADAGYVLLRFGTRQPVFMDDRFDMYPQSVIDDFTTVNAGARGWKQVLVRRDVEVVVWGRDRVLTQLLRQESGWRRTYRDARHVVFVRDDVGA